MARFARIPSSIKRKKIKKKIQVCQATPKKKTFSMILTFHICFCFVSIGCFDVYNIETALPVIDMETIENHLKSVKEDERRVSN